MKYLLGIEGGGTTFTAALAFIENPTVIIERIDIPTSNPKETLKAIKEWFLPYYNDILSIGIATFGPIDANINSSTYGFITDTPKNHWKNTDILSLLELRNIDKKVVFDTDVNAPALLEFSNLKLNDESINSCAYITVGTGVGVGLVINNQSVKGLLHPEAGHIKVPQLNDNDHSDQDKYQGYCPFHKDCIEGIIGSNALCAQTNLSNSENLKDLSDDHDIWKKTAFQLAHLCINLMLIASPQKIIIGGGILNRKCLYPMIRKYVIDLMNGYITPSSSQIDIKTESGIANYITSSEFGSSAGLIGAIYLGTI